MGIFLLYSWASPFGFPTKVPLTDGGHVRVPEKSTLGTERCGSRCSAGAGGGLRVVFRV